MPLIDLFAIPGYAVAADAEQALRDGAFLEMPENIGGIPVQPLTLQLYNRLVAIRSPFVVGGKFSAADIGNVLWTVSPRWRPMATRLDRKGHLIATGPSVWKKYVFLHQHRRSIVVKTINADGKKALLPVATTAIDIYSYIDEAFYDSYNGGSNGARAKSYSSWNAILIHDFKKAYNWEPERTQTTPLRILFQLRKSILRDANPKHALHNRSDQILEAHFIKRNEAKSSARLSTIDPSTIHDAADNQQN